MATCCNNMLAVAKIELCAGDYLLRELHAIVLAYLSTPRAIDDLMMMHMTVLIPDGLSWPHSAVRRLLSRACRVGNRAVAQQLTKRGRYSRWHPSCMNYLANRMIQRGNLSAVRCIKESFRFTHADCVGLLGLACACNQLKIAKWLIVCCGFAPGRQPGIDDYVRRIIRGNGCPNIVSLLRERFVVGDCRSPADMFAQK